MSPGKEKLLALFGAFGGLAIAVLSYLAVPRFNNSVEELGVELPPLTRFILDYYQVTWLLPPLLVLLTWYFWPPRKHRAIAAFSIGIGGAVLVFLIALLAMYLAVFQSAAAI